LIAGAALLSGALAGAVAGAAPSVLVFTKTAGFRHDSIPAAVAAIRRLGATQGFAVQATEDDAVFTDAGLEPHDAVVFLLTTGDVLTPAQLAALQRFVRSGRGFVGVHSASDTEHGSAWYVALVGAEFRNHPPPQPATVRVIDGVHASTRGLPAAWIRTDEWYDFAANPRPSVHVLATVDEATYTGGAMGADHPIAWCRFFDGGRTWYTALGHTAESWSEPLFLEHVLGGIGFAAGWPDCTAPRTRAVDPRPATSSNP
jgi:cytochrome c